MFNTVNRQTQKSNDRLFMISKSVTRIIFVEFIDQLIDYPINRANLTKYHARLVQLVQCPCSIYLSWGKDFISLAKKTIQIMEYIFFLISGRKHTLMLFKRIASRKKNE